MDEVVDPQRAPNGRRRRAGGLLALSVVIAVVAAACDRNDGRTMRQPSEPTTIPAPSTSVATELVNGVPTSLPLLPGELDPATDPSSTTVGGGGGIATMTLFTPWANGGAIDIRYGCDGIDRSPPLSWTGVPDGTVELGLVFEDLSNTSNGRPFIHWAVAGIDPTTTVLAEGETAPGAIVGLNFFGDVGWTGPCPNPGNTNTYRLTLYALGQQIEMAEATPAAELVDLLATVAIGTASVDGTSTR